MRGRLVNKEAKIISNLILNQYLLSFLHYPIDQKLITSESSLDRRIIRGCCAQTVPPHGKQTTLNFQKQLQISPYQRIWNVYNFDISEIETWLKKCLTFTHLFSVRVGENWEKSFLAPHDLIFRPGFVQWSGTCFTGRSREVTTWRQRGQHIEMQQQHGVIMEKWKKKLSIKR